MISSTVYNLKHKDGLNQRVQQVTFDSLNEIEFLLKTQLLIFMILYISIPLAI